MGACEREMNAEDSPDALTAGAALRTGLGVFGDLSLAVLLILGGTFDLRLSGIAGSEIAGGERSLEKKTGQSVSFGTGHGALALQTMFVFGRSR